MPKINNAPPRPATLKSDEINKKPPTVSQPATHPRTTNQFQSGPGRPSTQQLNPSGTPLPSPAGDLYGASTPQSLEALDQQRGFVPVKIPTAAELAGAPRVTFGQTGGPNAGEIKAGGKLVVEYAADRSPVQENLGSVPAWGVTAFIEFQPSGTRVSSPAVAFGTSNGGHVDPRPQSVPIAVDVPPGTTGVSMWFRQFKGADHPGEAWDSNYGKNYQFDVK